METKQKFFVGLAVVLLILIHITFYIKMPSRAEASSSRFTTMSTYKDAGVKILLVKDMVMNECYMITTTDGEKGIHNIRVNCN